MAMFTRVKTASEVKAMRVSGRMLASVLAVVASKVEPEVTTKKLADIAASELKKLGGKPAFLGYQGFPDVICISLNDEVVHGIPSLRRVVTSEDIVSLDFGVNYEGMISDGAISVIAGKAKPVDTKLVEQTKLALLAGINVVKDGVRTGDIGAAVQAILDKNHYGIVRDLVGHGVGHQLHEDPNVPNYGFKNTGERLVAGMTIAIEPMATLGSFDVGINPDGWTVRTLDGSRSAHFEHTVLITENGAEIMTELG